jgi:hypothetical protein
LPCSGENATTAFSVRVTIMRPAPWRTSSGEQKLDPCPSAGLAQAGVPVLRFKATRVAFSPQGVKRTFSPSTRGLSA